MPLAMRGERGASSRIDRDHAERGSQQAQDGAVDQGGENRHVVRVAEQPQAGGEAPLGQRGGDLVGAARQLAQHRQQGEQFAGGGVAQRGGGELLAGELPGQGLGFGGDVEAGGQGAQGAVEDDQGAEDAADDRGEGDARGGRARSAGRG